MLNTILLQGTNAVLNPVVQHKAAEEFYRLDPYGIGMAVIAMTVVFVSLILIYFCLKLVGMVLTNKFNFKPTKEHIINNNVPDDVIPAIALAMYLYQKQIHDEERTILTIQKVVRTYSPWSSKIYGLRKNPR